MPNNEASGTESATVKKFRFRASFQKLGESKGIPHLELIRNLRQAFADAQIPVSYSGNARPQAQISFGPALPVSVQSREEFIDFLATRYVAPEEFLKRMNQVLPTGLRFLQAIPISRNALSLCAVINGADYTVDFRGSAIPALQPSIEEFKSKDTVPVTKHKNEKILNAKDYVRSLAFEETTRQLSVEMKIIDGVTVGIHEIIRAIAGSGEELPVFRERLYIWNNGRKQSPLMAEWEQIQLQKHLMNLMM